MCRFGGVKCPNVLFGCKEIVDRQDIENHLNLKCQHKPVVCKWCGKNVPNKEVSVTGG